MKYYKVVRKEKRGLFSALVSERNRFRRKYEKGKWVEAIGKSFLFVFSTELKAKCFVTGIGASFDISGKIWECEIDGKRKLSYRLWADQDFRSFEIFWDGFKLSNLQTPRGTVGAKRVKLIKEIS